MHTIRALICFAVLLVPVDYIHSVGVRSSDSSKVHGAYMGPVGPMLARWTLLSGSFTLRRPYDRPNPIKAHMMNMDNFLIIMLSWHGLASGIIGFRGPVNLIFDVYLWWESEPDPIQTVELSVIWDAEKLMLRHYNDVNKKNPDHRTTTKALSSYMVYNAIAALHIGHPNDTRVAIPEHFLAWLAACQEWQTAWWNRQCAIMDRPEIKLCGFLSELNSRRRMIKLW